MATTFSWDLPSPPSLVPAPGTAASALLATVRSLNGPLLDLVLDPVTLDYVDTEDGDWLETADSRTLVMCMIEIELDGDYFTPEDGSRIKAMIREREGAVLDEEIVAEVRRVLQVVVSAGVISDASVSFRREGSELGIECNWTDVASGSPVDLNYHPYAET